MTIVAVTAMAVYVLTVYFLWASWGLWSLLVGGVLAVGWEILLAALIGYFTDWDIR